MGMLNYWEVTSDFLRLVFDNTIKVSTLINSNFTVTTQSASPTLVSNPFRAINLGTDYQSISRSLTLWWNTALQPGEVYTVYIRNLVTITGIPIADEYVTFSTEQGATPNTPDLSGRVTREPIDIEDYSIKTVPSFDDTGSGGGDDDPVDPDFLHIVDVVPDLTLGYQIPPQGFGGKIVVEFSEKPLANYINSSDFRLQRKKLTGISHWEAVNTIVMAESEEPKVSIYLPSTDSSPVYSFEGEEAEATIYWEPGYKYRLMISKNVGV